MRWNTHGRLFTDSEFPGANLGFHCPLVGLHFQNLIPAAGGTPSPAHATCTRRFTMSWIQSQAGASKTLEDAVLVPGTWVGFSKETCCLYGLAFLHLFPWDPRLCSPTNRKLECVFPPLLQVLSHIVGSKPLFRSRFASRGDTLCPHTGASTFSLPGCHSFREECWWVFWPRL